MNQTGWPRAWPIFVAACLTSTSRAEPADELRAAIQRHQGASIAGLEFARVFRDGDQPATRELCVGEGRRSAHCELLAIAGSAPTEKQLARYAKQHRQPVDSELPILDLNNWIDDSSLEIIAITPERITARFKAAAPDDATWRNEGSMTGTLEVDRVSGMLIHLQQSNSRKFSPAPGVKVKRMSVEVEFDDRLPLARRLRIEAQGRALALMRVEQIQEYAFENFSPSPAADD